MKQNIGIELTRGALDTLKNEGFDLQYGARPLKRLIQKRIVDNLSMAMLQEKVTPGMHVTIDAEEGKFVFRERELSADVNR
jgi:ATP-dependent Clp protease ATP-binding subunit ClpA